MLKKVNIDCGEKGVATVAKITYVAKDMSHCKADLYLGAVKAAKIYGDLTEELQIEKDDWVEYGLLETNRTFNEGELPFSFTLADYRVFYPAEPTAEQILAAKIASLKNEAIVVQARLDAIVVELKELEG